MHARLGVMEFSLYGWFSTIERSYKVLVENFIDNLLFNVPLHNNSSYNDKRAHGFSENYQ